MLPFEGSEHELRHAGKILDFVIAARFVHASMTPWQDRYAERESGCKWTDRDKMIRFVYHPLAESELLFEHITDVAALMRSMVLSHPIFDPLNVIGDKIGTYQLAMGVDQRRTGVGTIVLEYHGITHVQVSSPVIQSLAVSFEHQRCMLRRQSGDATDMIRRLDNDFMSSLRLPSLKKLAPLPLLLLITEIKCAGISRRVFFERHGRMNSGVLVGNDSHEPWVFLDSLQIDRAVASGRVGVGTRQNQRRFRSFVF